MASKRKNKERPSPTRKSKVTGSDVLPDSGRLYQFKITLLDSRPPIWRRIQVRDCTLDDLHEHIQLAMGWTNSHLHQFHIDNRIYGDPDLLVELMEEFQAGNSRVTMLSDLLPKTRKRFRLFYEYDFGDGWEHEILFEGVKEAAPGARYPLCLEGERACPPEDVGGVWGYRDFVKAITNPKHEDHEHMLQWNGPFDPEAFSPDAATKDMRKGLPDWRSMR
jgi:hypothetical protein